MLILAALASAALGGALGAAPGALDPEMEALMKRRDEKRQQTGETQLVQKRDSQALAAVIPPAIADRLAACLAKANDKPEDGLADAVAWAKEGGGAYAVQCKGYSLGNARRFTEAAAAFEGGGSMTGLEPVMRARLWSQAGNAALASGDAQRAARDLDQALDKPLPATLSTGEIHLDRARARVALNNPQGARTDLNQALVLANADPLAWLLSATLARRVNDLPLARLHIEEAAKRARNDGPIALEQGVIYALSGDRDPAAQAAFQRAIELSPGSETATKAKAYLAQLSPETETPEPTPAPVAKPVQTVR
jgi:tetratricopeptide (TPR) repeat protein